jgi:hypothetical protein
VKVRKTVQSDLTRSPVTADVVRAIVRDRERVQAVLAPETNKLALRVACPVEGCGLADKHGLSNIYDDVNETITFECPSHGPHTVDLRDPDDVARLEFNTPLRNLVRALVYSSDPHAHHIRVTGADYAGLYQEQLLYRLWVSLANYDGYGERRLRSAPPVFVYSPLIVDWAGSKLSKSLYVKEGACRYLDEQKADYLLSMKRMKEMGKDVKVLYDEVARWVDDPRRLFPPYSVEYLHAVFSRAASSD